MMEKPKLLYYGHPSLVFLGMLYAFDTTISNFSTILLIFLNFHNDL